jgi:hypothetical protein
MAGIQTVKHNLVKVSPQFQLAVRYQAGGGSEQDL